MDLGALALYIMWHALALRSSSAVDYRLGFGFVLCVDIGSCAFVHVVSRPSVDLGVSNHSHRHCGDDFHHCSL